MRLVKYFSYSSLASFVQYGYTYLTQYTLEVAEHPSLMLPHLQQLLSSFLESKNWLTSRNSRFEPQFSGHWIAIFFSSSAPRQFEKSILIQMILQCIFFYVQRHSSMHRLDNSGWIVIEIISPNTFLFPSTVQMFVYLWRRTS